MDEYFECGALPDFGRDCATDLAGIHIWKIDVDKDAWIKFRFDQATQNVWRMFFGIEACRSRSVTLIGRYFKLRGKVACVPSNFNCPRAQIHRRRGSE